MKEFLVHECMLLILDQEVYLKIYHIGLLDDIYLFYKQFYYRIDEIEELLTNNRI